MATGTMWTHDDFKASVQQLETGSAFSLFFSLSGTGRKYSGTDSMKLCGAVEKKKKTDGRP